MKRQMKATTCLGLYMARTLNRQCRERNLNEADPGFKLLVRIAVENLNSHTDFPQREYMGNRGFRLKLR